MLNWQLVIHIVSTWSPKSKRKYFPLSIIHRNCCAQLIRSIMHVIIRCLPLAFIYWPNSRVAGKTCSMNIVCSMISVLNMRFLTEDPFSCFLCVMIYISLREPDSKHFIVSLQCAKPWIIFANEPEKKNTVSNSYLVCLYAKIHNLPSNWTKVSTTIREMMTQLFSTFVIRWDYFYFYRVYFVINFPESSAVQREVPLWDD